MTTKSDFLTVSQVEAFVDKTLLLKHILQGQPYKLLTAPRRFGKSTNLDMIKMFLSIAVDSEGRRKPKNYTELHEIFKKLLIYKKENTFFYQNFGMFPVIQVNFKTSDPIKKSSDAIKIIRNRIHKSYKQHSYLFNSKYLDSKERKLFNIWSCDEHKNLNEESVSLGLVYLAKLLYKHFDCTKVFVIIDEYDTLVTAATFMAKYKELASILALITTQLSQILKSNHIKGALVCGVSALPSLSLSTSNSRRLVRYRFLEDHPLVDFYGFTEKEVKKLFKKSIFNVDPKQVKKACLMYGGYTSKNGKVIWSIFSVLKFLQDGEPIAYLPPSIYVEHLMNAYRIPVIEKAIDTLLKEQTVKMNFQSRITVSDFLYLRKMYSLNPYYANANTELFLLHLLELGYLTYVIVPESDKHDTYVKLPNHETKQCLLEYVWNVQVFSKLYRKIEMVP